MPTMESYEKYITLKRLKTALNGISAGISAGIGWLPEQRGEKGQVISADGNGKSEWAWTGIRTLESVAERIADGSDPPMWISYALPVRDWDDDEMPVYGLFTQSPVNLGVNSEILFANQDGQVLFDPINISAGALLLICAMPTETFVAQLDLNTASLILYGFDFDSGTYFPYAMSGVPHAALGSPGMVPVVDQYHGYTLMDLPQSLPKPIQIQIPTTGWVDNKQTFVATGIPAEPWNHVVTIAQHSAYVEDARACGLYIVSEAQDSLTLGVSSIPEEAFSVFAIVTPIQGVGH